MLPRSFRFTSEYFIKARKDMKSFRAGGFLFLYSLKRGMRRYYNFAVVVPKKKHKLAVTRNKIRRISYEIIRKDIAPEIIKNLKTSIDLICLYQGTTIPQSTEVFFNFKKFLRKIMISV